jgi:multiple sugar transport system permease protein
MTPLLERVQNSRNVLGLIFMMPAALLLLLFLTYPLGLGVWLGFTDTKIGTRWRMDWFRKLQFFVGR